MRTACDVRDNIIMATNHSSQFGRFPFLYIISSLSRRREREVVGLSNMGIALRLKHGCQDNGPVMYWLKNSEGKLGLCWTNVNCELRGLTSSFAK